MDYVLGLLAVFTGHYEDQWIKFEKYLDLDLAYCECSRVLTVIPVNKNLL